MQITEVRELFTGVCGQIEQHLDEILETRFDVSWKADGSPVTSSDVFVEKLVHSYLAEMIGAVEFIGEESYSGRAESNGLCAILDPVDGTENFCSGLKEWGTALTLWDGESHQGSMLLMPELGERLMTGDALVPVRSRIQGFSSSMCPEIAAEIAGNGEYRIMGCSVYNMYNVARGAYARFSNPKGGHVWDVLPGLMLALEHGCDVFVEGKRFDGHYLEPNRKYRFDIHQRHDIRTGEGSPD